VVSHTVSIFSTRIARLERPRPSPWPGRGRIRESSRHASWGPCPRVPAAASNERWPRGLMAQKSRFATPGVRDRASSASLSRPWLGWPGATGRSPASGARRPPRAPPCVFLCDRFHALPVELRADLRWSPRSEGLSTRPPCPPERGHEALTRSPALCVAVRPGEAARAGCPAPRSASRGGLPRGGEGGTPCRAPGGSRANRGAAHVLGEP